MNQKLLCLLLVTVAAEAADWSYSGEHGPEHWADMYPECGGNKQSPISINIWDLDAILPLPAFTFNGYESVPDGMTIKNTGHSAEVSLTGSSMATVNGAGLVADYTFAQLHFHWGSDDQEGGSEHTIDRERFAGELHYVHYKTRYGSMDAALDHDDGVAVLSTMLELSEQDNDDLKSVVENLHLIQYPGDTSPISPFPLRSLLPANLDHYYRYEGSLTTPDCNEAVVWTVFQDPISISSQQLTEFRQLVGSDGLPLQDNFRPDQPLHGRPVYKGTTIHH